MARLKGQIAQDKELFQFLPRNRSNDRLIASQGHGCFQGVADQFVLARAFDRLADHATEIEQVRDRFSSLRVLIFGDLLRKCSDVDGICPAPDNPTLLPP